jgi:hypothetical protein
MQETVSMVALIVTMFLIGAATILVVDYAIESNKQPPTISGRLIP